MESESASMPAPVWYPALLPVHPPGPIVPALLVFIWFLLYITFVQPGGEDSSSLVIIASFPLKPQQKPSFFRDTLPDPCQRTTSGKRHSSVLEWLESPYKVLALTSGIQSDNNNK